MPSRVQRPATWTVTAFAPSWLETGRRCEPHSPRSGGVASRSATPASGWCRKGDPVRLVDGALFVSVAFGAACSRTSNAPPPPPMVQPLAVPTASARPPESPQTVIGLYTRACDAGSAVGCNDLAVAILDGKSG